MLVKERAEKGNSRRCEEMVGPLGCSFKKDSKGTLPIAPLKTSTPSLPCDSLRKPFCFLVKLGLSLGGWKKKEGENKAEHPVPQPEAFPALPLNQNSTAWCSCIICSDMFFTFPFPIQRNQCSWGTHSYWHRSREGWVWRVIKGAPGKSDTSLDAATWVQISSHPCLVSLPWMISKLVIPRNI